MSSDPVNPSIKGYQDFIEDRKHRSDGAEDEPTKDHYDKEIELIENVIVETKKNSPEDGKEPEKEPAPEEPTPEEPTPEEPTPEEPTPEEPTPEEPTPEEPTPEEPTPEEPTPEEPT